MTALARTAMDALGVRSALVPGDRWVRSSPVGFDNGVVTGHGADGQGVGMDLERARAVMDSLLHPNPALKRLLQVVREHPELCVPRDQADTQDSPDGNRARGRVGSVRPATSSSRESAGVRAAAVGGLAGDESRVLPLVVDYANGLTQAEIAAKYGLHVQTVRKRLAEAGVSSRAHNQTLSDEDLWRARRLIDSGLSAREVAGRYGVAHTTLLRALKRTGSAVARGGQPRDGSQGAIPSRAAAELGESSIPDEVASVNGGIESDAGDELGASSGARAVPVDSHDEHGASDQWGGHRSERLSADVRGVVIPKVEGTRTYLTKAGIDSLVADYQAGAGVGELARRYGIHRSTVTAHLRRRNLPQRQTGLNTDQQAEAVRLYRDGLSLRAISRRMGVDRKAVRASLASVNLLIES